MDYSYLNHHHHAAAGGFDPSSCAMPCADGGVLAACNLAGAGPYGELAVRCGPGPMGPSPQHAVAAAAYGAYGAMRGHHQYAAAPPPHPAPMTTGSCSMIPRPRDHPQPTMFATGEWKCGVQSAAELPLTTAINENLLHRNRLYGYIISFACFSIGVYLTVILSSRPCIVLAKQNVVRPMYGH